MALGRGYHGERPTWRVKEMTCARCWGFFHHALPGDTTRSESAWLVVVNSAQEKYRVRCSQPACFSVCNFFPPRKYLSCACLQCARIVGTQWCVMCKYKEACTT